MISRNFKSSCNFCTVCFNISGRICISEILIFSIILKIFDISVIHLSIFDSLEWPGHQVLLVLMNYSFRFFPDCTSIASKKKDIRASTGFLIFGPGARPSGAGAPTAPCLRLPAREPPRRAFRRPRPRRLRPRGRRDGPP